jgi:hypothetical protein
LVYFFNCPRHFSPSLYDIYSFVSIQSFLYKQKAQKPNISGLGSALPVRRLRHHPRTGSTPSPRHHHDGCFPLTFALNPVRHV